ncbi:hypothetical protein A3L09_02285 [Thermococcus profundus]|uniref:Uncharacterized protein n=1 Tax=Thermococcus profundus TaxID=49899 RepID=A0A2Z2M900_THEPR|nr:hypothetical protein [Thermococcus profundus]ASJ02176.1 hypothetical protein A3L09_02285 [Thermococcus profundus]
MGEDLSRLQGTYRKLMLAGLFLLLTAFGLLILKPFGTASIVVGALLFPVAMVPLELARRAAQRLALMAINSME